MPPPVKSVAVWHYLEKSN